MMGLGFGPFGPSRPPESRDVAAISQCRGSGSLLTLPWRGEDGPRDGEEEDQG